MIVSSLHELYAQKHMSLYLLNSGQIDISYQLMWLKMCTEIVFERDASIRLVDFVTTLFNNFNMTWWRVIESPKNKSSIFYYSVDEDEKNRFRVRTFKAFLKTSPQTYESDHMKTLRMEILNLLEQVDLIKRNTKFVKQIKFVAGREYKLILRNLLVKYQLRHLPTHSVRLLYVNNMDGGIVNYQICN